MTPLKVTAVMSEPIAFGFGTVALDALLASQVVRREGRSQLVRGQPIEDPPVPPLERHSAGFYMASWALPGRLMWSHQTYIHRPAPADWYARLCTDKVKRVDIGSGEDKSHRVPRYRTRYDSLVWYCIGDAVELAELLRGVTRLGSNRRDGIGKRREWRVEAVTEPWEGFPVLQDGKPLRSLPLDFPGLADEHNTGWASLTFPYWDPLRQEMLAIP